jgi:hypothetical protein
LIKGQATTPLTTTGHDPMAITRTQINCRNIVNAKANEVEGHLARIFSPYQGKKVWKTSGYGGLIAKLQKEIEAYEYDHNISHPWRLVLRSDVSWITATLDYFVSEVGYTKECIFLGKRNDKGVLVELSECIKRPQFIDEEVFATEKRIWELEKQARELKSTISCLKYSYSS